MSHESIGSNISLCDALDRILTKGVVVYGDISISVAGVDLLYIGLRGLISAIDALDEVPASLQRPPGHEDFVRHHNGSDGEGRLS